MKFMLTCAITMTHDNTEGLRVLYPVVDVIKYVHTLKEIVIEIPSQSGITQDNVTMHLDAVIYIKIDNPYKASYGVEDPEYAVAQLAQTTMRSELGQLKLDEVFKERATLNWNIVEAINEAAIPWGLKCLRCEIKDIALPDTVVEDMQRQVSAERRKRYVAVLRRVQRAQRAQRAASYPTSFPTTCATFYQSRQCYNLPGNIAPPFPPPPPTPPPPQPRPAPPRAARPHHTPPVPAPHPPGFQPGDAHVT